MGPRTPWWGLRPYSFGLSSLPVANHVVDKEALEESGSVFTLPLGSAPWLWNL